MVQQSDIQARAGMARKPLAHRFGGSHWSFVFRDPHRTSRQSGPNSSHCSLGQTVSHFRPLRRRLTVTAYRQHRGDHAFTAWREVAGVVARSARALGS